MSSYIDRIRKYVGHNKVLIIFASACIRDNNGRLLWQRRADFGWWGLPGGILEPGESLSGCIMREAREETGLEIEPIHLVGIYSSPDFDVTYPNGDQVQQVTVCFDCRIVGGKLMSDRKETLDLAWFPMDEMPPSALWYMAMVKDLALGQKAATFDRGVPGRQVDSNSIFNLILTGKAPLLMPAVSAYVKDRNGCVLLQRSKDGEEWGLPCFFMGLGERIDQTLINGLLRETGSKPELIKLIGIYSDYENGLIDPFRENLIAINALFRCRLITKDPYTEGIKSSRLRFFSYKALPSMSESVLRQLQDGLINREEAVF